MQLSGTLAAIRAAAVIASVVALACVPMRAWERPDFSGRVHRGSTPISDVTITWHTLSSTDSEGAVSSASGRTDARGEFAIKGQRKWTVGMLLPADAIVRWRVDLEFEGKTIVLWKKQLVTASRTSTPGRVVIDCDVAKADPCVVIDTDERRLLRRSEQK
jgi:hypothetical protein